MDVLTISPLALTKLQQLLAEDGSASALRVFVSGGGCSGLQYGMALDTELRDDDKVIELEGTKIWVDPVSLPYLQGSNIDYIDDLMQSGFTFQNPNAVKSCSCGHSFDAGDEGGSAKPCGSN